MPTGYTYGIIDGKTKTFEDFAKQCMRAFGATMHMRDDSMDVEYTPRTPSKYHLDSLIDAKNLLNYARTATDEDIIKARISELKKERKSELESIDKAKKSYDILNNFLIKARAFIPPTKEHDGIAKFMIEQLESTINHDCETDFHDNELIKIDSELRNINVDVIRLDIIQKANDDIKYYLKEHKAELKRCEESNKWVSDFINALN